MYYLLSCMVLSATIAAAQAPPDAFVRKEVQLRAGPSAVADRLALLRPGKLLSIVGPLEGDFAKVRTEDGREGFVFAANVKRIDVLELEAAFEEVGPLPAALPEGAETSVAAMARAAAAQCPSFDACPAFGCTTNVDHRRSNRAKRRAPDASDPPKLLTRAILEGLQEETDHRNVPQGEVLTLADRNKLKDISVGGLTLSEGDFVAFSGFIAKDRTIRCGGKETVNCKHSSSASGPCTKSDIHIPLVGDPDDEQVDSVVVEPIPQRVKEGWTPSALMDLKGDEKRLLVHGGLFYDSQHVVNPSGNLGSEPKRYTVWEVHPVTRIFVCEAATCDPADPSAWTELE